MIFILILIHMKSLKDTERGFQIMNNIILVKGAGEHATGTAHRLFSAGFGVIMTEIPMPQCVRRNVSFANAVYENEITVEGVKAVLIKDISEYDPSAVAVIVDENAEILEKLEVDIVIDARIAKRNIDNSMDDAALVIGLGPGLEAGRDVHYVVETNRGHDLGRIISEGYAEADTGVPGTIKGESGKRVLRAPADGIIRNHREIGETVHVDDLIASVGEYEVKSKLDGIIRGLIKDGSRVDEGLKIGDVDPRIEERNCHTLSDKTRTISGSVLELVTAFRNGKLS